MGRAPPPPPQLLHLRQKMLESLAKLSDRDTFSLATAELHSLLHQSLDVATLPTFLSAFTSTLSSAPSPSARKHILSLVSTLAKSHPTFLSQHVSSLVPPLSRLFRDPDSSVRAVLPSTVASLPIASPEQLDLLVRTFSESLFTEQDPHARVAAGACLSAVIEKYGVREDGGERLGKVLGKCEKAMRSKGWKGKVGVMRVVGSMIGMMRRKEVKSMVGSVLVCLGSEDWAERKAAAEVLLKLAKNAAAGEFKNGCVAALEKRRFDKVKAVREVMNQALEAWKQVPDVISEISPPLRESVASLKESARDENCRGAPKYSPSANSSGLPMRKKQSPLNQFTPPDCLSAMKRNGCKSTSPALQTKKPRKVEIAVSNFSSAKGGSEADLKERDENIIPVRKGIASFEVSKPETRRALYRKSSDENVHKFVGLRSGSRVAPCHDKENPGTAVVVSNSSDYLHQSRKDCEDLSMIRSQLLQIEKQQSSLLDLLQKFMGSSQNGMRSLETRVHGLELALDEISYDLAVTSGRMTNGDTTPSAGTSCCMLPGDFLSPKFWRKSESRFSSASRFTPSLTRSARFRGDKTCDKGATKAEIQRFRPHGNTGFVVNPLAKIPGVEQ